MSRRTASSGLVLGPCDIHMRTWIETVLLLCGKACQGIKIIFCKQCLGLLSPSRGMSCFCTTTVYQPHTWRPSDGRACNLYWRRVVTLDLSLAVYLVRGCLWAVSLPSVPVFPPPHPTAIPIIIAYETRVHSRRVTPGVYGIIYG